MLDLKLNRQRDFRMLLPQHHKTSLSIPVRGKTALRAMKHSTFGPVRMTAFRTVATGAAFPNEARCHTGFLSLVFQILLDTARFHLRDFLPVFSGKPFMLLRVLLHSGEVADHQFGNAMVGTPVNCLPGGVMEKVLCLGISFTFEAPFGADQLLPAAAAFGAPGQHPAELAKRFVALPLDRADLPAGDHQDGTIFGSYRDRMNLTDVDTSADADHWFSFGIVREISKLHY